MGCTALQFGDDLSLWAPTAQAWAPAWELESGEQKSVHLADAWLSELGVEPPTLTCSQQDQWLTNKRYYPCWSTLVASRPYLSDTSTVDPRMLHQPPKDLCDHLGHHHEH